MPSLWWKSSGTQGGDSQTPVTGASDELTWGRCWRVQNPGIPGLFKKKEKTTFFGWSKQNKTKNPLECQTNCLLCCSILNCGIKDQIRSVAQSCPTLCDPMNRSTPGLHVHHQLPEFTQTHVHRVGDAIQPSHTLSSPSPLAPNPSQHQSLFQWVNSSYEVAKVLEFQL